MHQLSMFDIVSRPQTFRFGDAVKVIETTDDMDAETYFYLQDFSNKKGLVAKVVKQPELQYHVDFNGRIGIVYHDELINY